MFPRICIRTPVAVVKRARAEIVPRNGCPAAARSTLHKTLIRTVVVGPHIYTVHTGDRTPAVYLAETEEHWHMPWPFG